MENPMKFLIVGLGSMGKRRIRNLLHLGHTEIVGYDPREDRCNETCETLGIKAVSDWGVAQETDADAWVISTPPDTHMEYGFAALDREISFFTEASVTDDRAPEMVRRLVESDAIGAPSCTFRYYAGPRKIKQLLGDGKIGRPLMFTYHSGQYLPDWHPWESYKDFYVSKRETGACREIVPFELCWLVDILGELNKLTCLKDKVSDLDTDIDDVYQLLLGFEDGISGHLVVDVIARPAVRVFRLCGTEGTVEWDHTANTIRLWTAETGDWEIIKLGRGTVEAGYIHAEEPYIDEMADFVAAVKGEKIWQYSYEDDEKILDFLIRAELSSDTGTHQ
jgi:predicted dehydrogenase